MLRGGGQRKARWEIGVRKSVGTTDHDETIVIMSCQGWVSMKAAELPLYLRGMRHVLVVAVAIGLIELTMRFATNT